jgi:hypothetical protein
LGYGIWDRIRNTVTCVAGNWILHVGLLVDSGSTYTTNGTKGSFMPSMKIVIPRALYFLCPDQLYPFFKSLPGLA